MCDTLSGFIFNMFHIFTLRVGIIKFKKKQNAQNQEIKYIGQVKYLFNKP